MIVISAALETAEDVCDKTHQALFSRGYLFGKCLIAAPLRRNRKSRFEKIEVAALTFS